MAIDQVLKSAELFAGAGGQALGVSRAGFTHIAVVESNPIACESLRSNKDRGVEHVRDWEIMESDIAKMTFDKFSELDLLSGGPPCQPFSHAGKRSGRSDPRDMFPHFIRAVRLIRPKAFIIENVRGLVGPSFMEYFTYIVHQLRFPEEVRTHREKWTEHRARLENFYTGGKYDRTEYRVIWQTLNAADFGVGQKRERVFIVGIRSDLELKYSFPLPTHSRMALLHDEFVSGEYWERHRIPKRKRPVVPPNLKHLVSKLTERSDLESWTTVRDVISDLPNVGLGRKSHTVLNHFLNPGARSYPGHDGSSLDAPAKTIKAGHNGVPGGENMLRLDDGTVRYFSVRECARLQAFPDSWAFEGAWCSGMRQIGNAVPVTLSEMVAKPIATALRSRFRSVQKSA